MSETHRRHNPAPEPAPAPEPTPAPAPAPAPTAAAVSDLVKQIIAGVTAAIDPMGQDEVQQVVRHQVDAALQPHLAALAGLTAAVASLTEKVVAVTKAQADIAAGIAQAGKAQAGLALAAASATEFKLRARLRRIEAGLIGVPAQVEERFADEIDRIEAALRGVDVAQVPVADGDGTALTNEVPAVLVGRAGETAA